MSDLLAAWDSDIPFAMRAWHRCPSCKFDEGKGDGRGTPPWHICTIKVSLPSETGQGLTCNRYAPLPWVRPMDESPKGQPQ